MTDPLNNLAAPSVDQPRREFVDRLRTRIEAIEARTPKRVFHLAELNLGTFKAPLESAPMTEFANSLDRINAIADEAPGFVWRLTTDDGGPSSNVPVPGADDPLLASNLSVWTSYEALRDYMYKTDHVSYLRRRSEWFQHHDEAMTVAWWVPAGTIPTLEDALQRLDNLRVNGPSDEGWPLTQPRPAPTNHLGETVSSDSVSSEAESSQPVLIPYLTVADAKSALLFYQEVFGAEPQGEVFEMDDGRIGHAELSVRGQTLYLADDFPEMNLVHPAGHGGPTSMALVIHVDDCDAVYEHALAAGAAAERAPANQHGFRIGWFVDPSGHRWSVTGPETSHA